ncbi:MAG: hypothetical protein ACREIT_08745, partial [Tepidisphaeraceae bacterium]
AVLFRPAHFYRHLATRPTIDRSSLFARLHWLLAAILIGFGVFVHTRITDGSETMGIIGAGPVVPAMITYVLLELITLAAARLTAWEAAYRGLRLPPRAVRRGLHFHAAHYLPVGLLFLGTVVGYESTRFGGMEVTTYLYILCAQVIVVAAYLFNTYWIGMRNMMYANR